MIQHDDRAAHITLERLLPRLVERHADADPVAWALLLTRLHTHFPRLFALLRQLYGHHYDFYYHLEQLLAMMARQALTRPADLHALDAAREADPRWFHAHTMVGGVLYVNLFADTLQGVRERLPYLTELGLTYLHLMPIFPAPAGNNDGGYAVSNYHEVDPTLGTVADLRRLATDLRQNGISLVLDFVLNHTSDEHPWALAARSGDPDYQSFYYMFPDRTLPDAYERNLREIFPDQRPGSFTYRADLDRWVWTTFNSFQWDLNYSNPAVFTAMANEMLILANYGVEVLRFDALAFVWKKMGTDCESQPEAHLLLQAFNAVTRISAPAMLFKSEAIVHPDQVAQYIRPDECQVSYNPLLMALLWESMATREVRLLNASLAHRFAIDPQCAWVNYIRSHDDIGWTFDDSDAALVGINGFDHRRFLNTFYTGRFPHSFAAGLPFQENPRTGDARISGTCAALAGLERAVLSGYAEDETMALRRIVLLYSVALSIGGIPLIYLGDEVGTLNDTSFYADPAKAGDSRWVHRSRTNWQTLDLRHDPATRQGRLYSQLRHLIAFRKSHPVLAGGSMQLIDTGDIHTFGYLRQHNGQRLLVLANMGESPRQIASNLLRLYGLGYTCVDGISGQTVRVSNTPLVLDAYQVLWLMPA